MRLVDADRGRVLHAVDAQLEAARHLHRGAQHLDHGVLRAGVDVLVARVERSDLPHPGELVRARARERVARGRHLRAHGGGGAEHSSEAQHRRTRLDAAAK